MPHDERASRAIRVATWNLNHWQQPLLPVDTRRGAWDRLAGRLGAQVALVQEAVPSPDLPRERAVYGELAGYRNWGSAVVALDPSLTIEPIRSVRMPWSSRRYLLDRSNPGSCAVARISAPDVQPITFVSLYCLLDGPGISSLHRAIADLLPLFDSPDGSRVVLGGDLNVTTATTDPRALARASAALAAVESLGLVRVAGVTPERPPAPADCACGGGEACGHIATWRALELDHLFVSPALAPGATRLATDPGVVDDALSDHLPLVLDLALADEPTPHAWNEEAFGVEVGRRHGAAARRTVEALVSWAERKERDLAAKAGVTAKVLTRFPTNGVTAEPELMLALDVQTEPRASQVLLSIHASGDVVVWLGGWKLAPFAEPAARHALRRALNGIPGVELDSRAVYRWPRIPLATFGDPANLAALAAVLDRLAEESVAPAPEAPAASTDLVAAETGEADAAATREPVVAT